MNRRSNIHRALAASASFALLATASVALAVPASAATTPAPGCATSWSSDVQGRDTTFVPGKSTGVWAWHDSKGWHIRATHSGGGKKVFAGTVRSTTKIHGVGVRIEGRDLVGRSADLKTLGFRFTNYGAVDGVDFQVSGCTPTLRIALVMDGKALPASQIHLGADASAASKNPFYVARR